MAVKIFLIEYEGLKLEVTATEAGTQTSLVVRCLEGSADINALYWGDDVDDTTQVDLGKSLNMNGTGEDWDGAVRLSDPGLGKAGVTKSTYLTEGNSLAPVLADVSFADLDKLGIRATSTSTAGGSIKGYDECASTPHESSEALFTENFDYKGDESVQKTYQDNGVDVFASVNLNAANGWVSGAPVGNINGSNPANSELGADGYGGIQATSPAPNGTDGFWLDTQNTPGQINISHVFEDNTTAIDGKTAVLEFDIAKQDLIYQGTHYATNPDASFDILVDGVVVAHAGTDGDASKGLDTDLWTANDMQHISIDLGYATTGQHTIQLVDTSITADVTGFSIDSIKISDWVI